MATLSGPGRRMPWHKGPNVRSIGFTPNSLLPELYIKADTRVVNNGASVFDGTTGYLSCSSSSSLNISNANQGMTLGGWFFVPSIMTINSCILAKYEAVNGYQYRLRQTGGTANTNFSVNVGTGGFSHQFSSNYTVGAWTFVCFSHSTSGTTSTIRRCTNGTFTQNQVTNASVNGSYVTAAGGLEVGRDPNTGAFAGLRIDNLFLFNRALTDSEVLQIYNSGNGINRGSLSSALSANLVSWWGMKQLSGNRLDTTGNNTLTATGGVTYGAGKVTDTPNNTEIVTRADDLSANLRNATQVFSANCPTYSTGAINGRPSLAFASSGQQFFDLAYSFDHTDTTVWMVANITDTGGGKCIIGADNGANGLKCIFADPENLNMRKGVTSIASSTSAATVGAFKVQEFYYNKTTGAYEYYSSNVANGSGTSGVTGTSGLTASFIGRAEATNIDRLDGSIAELVVVSRILTTAERLSLYNYAVARYGGTV